MSESTVETATTTVDQYGVLVVVLVLGRRRHHHYRHGISWNMSLVSLVGFSGRTANNAFYSVGAFGG